MFVQAIASISKDIETTSLLETHSKSNYLPLERMLKAKPHTMPEINQSISEVLQVLSALVFHNLTSTINEIFCSVFSIKMHPAVEKRVKSSTTVIRLHAILNYI